MLILSPAEIPVADAEWLAKARTEIDSKTKPPGSLGRLEEVAIRLCVLQQTLSPSVEKGKILLFAADHGLADEGVSQYPKIVTQEMLRNLANGGAAINAFCNANGLGLEVIDVGVDTALVFEGITRQKDASPHGTQSSLQGLAMTQEQFDNAVQAGYDAVDRAIREGHQAIGIGELGIGNTATAAALLAAESGLAGSRVTGRGTGVDDQGLERKTKIVDGVVEKHQDLIRTGDWTQIFRALGGLEIVAMAAAARRAALNRLVLIVDGFISMAAFLYALKVYPEDRAAFYRSAFFSHQSSEQGVVVAMERIDQLLGESGRSAPLLNLGFRLGEGTGAAVAFPLLRAAAHMASDMATFASAGVSEA
ncbi:nicotinate-nucleotide--dimethylbenzimidazole phosphoribosyltransferase [Polychytrium aggregatum]|uniref:nicotinate-nucleotide--dimethylbenzimidazole phosphoribosyltransferase n=1 Tax=Polychytrium aggregatum TaxID=110093 RepID=UPI0022FF2370|nr:nicotinate-nucleotide--dimethylbenzimidazole phosphoribosyltransferase [Polychytrium aggregatum]KAI9208312.1 nicotinate-nucleotide--dimethylbenzimidazole phosphoribosyltransferase [Polychytrium aggregatum]